jgi:hypothetical protein
LSFDHYLWREREVYFPEGPGVDGFKSKTREVTYTYTSNERRVDIHDLEVRMSAVAAKESKSRPSDPWKPEQSHRCPGVSGAVWQRRQSAEKFVVPLKSDLFRIVNPQSRTILARKVAKAAEALVSVVLVCFVMGLVVEA